MNGGLKPGFSVMLARVAMLTLQHSVLVPVAEETSKQSSKLFCKLFNYLIFFSVSGQLKAISEIFSSYLAAIECMAIQG